MKRVSRTPYPLASSIHQRLNMYALAAAAGGVGMLALAQPSEAKIVYTPAHVKLNNKEFVLDLNHDGKVDFYLVQRRLFQGRTASASSLSVCHAPFNTSREFCPGTARSSSAPNALNGVRVIPSGSAAVLRAGTKIQNGNRFVDKKPVFMGRGLFASTAGTSWSGPWVNSGKGVKNRYLGFKFKIKGKFHFGWARLTVTTAKGSFTSILTGYAYETIPGKAIVAGQTNAADDRIGGQPQAALTKPASEPVSLGLLAVGSPGLSIWRRKEQQAAN